MRQSHGDRTMIVRPPYDLAFLSQLVSLSYAVFLFYAFEVQSQLKMISCTRLINEIVMVKMFFFGQFVPFFIGQFGPYQW